jgi:glutaminase
MRHGETIISNVEYQQILNEIVTDIQPYLQHGEVANYIPQLSMVDKQKFGIALHTIDGRMISAGESSETFSIQSISKALTLTMAINIAGDDIWKRIGREPSGNAFNSLVQLETEHGIPRNPFINAGAIVVTDIILSKYTDAKSAILEFVNWLVPEDVIEFDSEVATSEKSTGHRNMALAYFIKSFNNLKNDPVDVLDAYFHQCALKMNCQQLASAFLFLANRGVNPVSNEIVTSPNHAKHICALMSTSGTYDAAGDFAYSVGLPGKSGVGGGIVCVMPTRFSLCVWSPGLDKQGNSLAGIKALELFREKTGISVF